MTGALVILLFTALVGLVLWLTDRRKPSEPEWAPAEEADAGECCGRHMVCEKTSLSPLSDKPEYFDDEELDRFAGRDPQSYTPQEQEEFRDILLTMREEEIAAWARALQVRGIAPPPSVRDEILLIVSELRNQDS